MPEKKQQDQNSTSDQTPQQEGALPPIAPQEQAPLEAKPATPEKPKRIDETVEGGHYVVNGRHVNANNEPLD